jgi:hypothetical protein
MKNRSNRINRTLAAAERRPSGFPRYSFRVIQKMYTIATASKAMAMIVDDR